MVQPEEVSSSFNVVDFFRSELRQSRSGVILLQTLLVNQLDEFSRVVAFFRVDWVRVPAQLEFKDDFALFTGSRVK